MGCGTRVVLERRTHMFGIPIQERLSGKELVEGLSGSNKKVFESKLIVCIVQEIAFLKENPRYTIEDLRGYFQFLKKSFELVNRASVGKKIEVEILNPLKELFSKRRRTQMKDKGLEELEEALLKLVCDKINALEGRTKKTMKTNPF